MRQRDEIVLVARLNKKAHVCIHEWYCHGDVLPVRQNRAPISPALLDGTKDVVPSKNNQVS